MPFKVLRDLHTNRLLSQNDGRVVLDGKATIVTMMLHLTVLLTFGVSYPMLGFAVAFTIFAETVSHKLTMGKFLFITKVFNSRKAKHNIGDTDKLAIVKPVNRAETLTTTTMRSSVQMKPLDVEQSNPEGADAAVVSQYNNDFTHPPDSPGIDSENIDETNETAALDLIIDEDEKAIIDDYNFDHRLTAGGNDFAMQVLEESNRDAWSGVHACIWYFIMMVSAFWALIFFDMAADKQENIVLGMEVILIYAGAVPIMIFFIGRVRYHPRALRFYRRCKAWISTCHQSIELRPHSEPGTMEMSVPAQQQGGGSDTGTKQVSDERNAIAAAASDKSAKRRSLPREFMAAIHQNLPFSDTLLRESVDRSDSNQVEPSTNKA
jgi:hypothetical protein